MSVQGEDQFLEVVVEPRFSHGQAERNSQSSRWSVEYARSTWSERDMEAVARLCRYVRHVAPPAMLEDFPGFHIYPGSSYIAFGSQGPEEYWAVRSKGSTWSVFRGDERSGETSDGPSFSHVVDAFKYIFYSWFKSYIGLLGTSLFGGPAPEVEVNKEEYSWELHRSLFSETEQQMMLENWRKLWEGSDKKKSGVSLEDYMTSGKDIYFKTDDRSSWFLTYRDWRAEDMSWGLAVSGEGFVDRFIAQIAARRKGAPGASPKL